MISIFTNPSNPMPNDYPLWHPLKSAITEGDSVACVIGRELYRGLAYECNLLPMSVHNYKYVIRYLNPIILLIDYSAIKNNISCSGDYAGVQWPYGVIESILIEADKSAIPSVLWITEGFIKNKECTKLIGMFKYVFCANHYDVEYLKASGKDSYHLPLCVQPALFNPFRHYDNEQPSIELILDVKGNSDISNRLIAGISEDMNGLVVNNLPCDIFGADFGISKLAGLLKFTKIFVSSDEQGETDETNYWRQISCLQAASSRTVCLHYGYLPEGDVRADFALQFIDLNDLLKEIVKLRKDDLYRERLAHLAWRCANKDHAYANRLSAILNTVGLVSAYNLRPKASLIFPTFRRDRLVDCLKTYKDTNYPNKEMILVFNGNEVPDLPDLENGLNGNSDVKVVNAPSELFAGSTLNLGHLYATGDYCFRLDDDDPYGEYYIYDMILMASSIGAQLFGKSPSYIYYENDGVYSRKTVTKPLSYFDSSYFSQTWLAGHSISGTFKLFHRYKYVFESYGAADSSLLISLLSEGVLCCATDRFNIAAFRSENTDSHTWKISKDALLKNTLEKISGLDEVMI